MFGCVVENTLINFHWSVELSMQAEKVSRNLFVFLDWKQFYEIIKYDESKISYL